MMNLAEGDRVRVSGPPGAVRGRVLQILHGTELPAIEGAPSVTTVRQVLGELGITHVAMIQHKNRQRRVLFAALHTAAGWRDLCGQTLSIERLSAAKMKTT